VPRRRKTLMPDAPLALVPSEILDQFVRQGPLSHEELEAAVRRFKKAIVERALGGELTHHLGYPPGGTKPEATTNHRNGTSGKTGGLIEPRLIAKHERRFAGFDDKILALYARGMTVREIQGFLPDMYAVEVSPDLIGTVTDAIVAEVTAWQSRPLEPMYPVVFFDALRVKIRDEATVRSKAVYLALAVLPDGTRDMLGIWIEQTEGAKFWMNVFRRAFSTQTRRRFARRSRRVRAGMARAASRSMKASIYGDASADRKVTALQRRRIPVRVIGIALTCPARNAGSTAHFCITLMPKRALTISRIASVNITNDIRWGSTPAGRRIFWTVKLSSAVPV
jgi:hypothetical protein